MFMEGATIYYIFRIKNSCREATTMKKFIHYYFERLPNYHHFCWQYALLSVNLLGVQSFVFHNLKNLEKSRYVNDWTAHMNCCYNKIVVRLIHQFGGNNDCFFSAIISVLCYRNKFSEQLSANKDRCVTKKRKI